MSETVARLEALRCAVALPERLAGSLGDYLDLGHPDDDEAAHAAEDMRRYQAEATAALEELSMALARARRASPHLVVAWVDWHRSRCRQILAEAGPERDAFGHISYHAVRQYVARETLAEWDRVLAGEKDYVRINDYYLGDYAAEAEALAVGGLE